MSFSRLNAVLALVVVFPACKPGEAEVEYPPSLTEVRIGEVEADDVVVPEDVYIPGVVVAPEQYDLGGDSAQKTDVSEMQELSDPDILEKHKGTYSYSAADGDLIDLAFEQDFVYDDVNQGSIGDCYFAAALSAVLYSDVNKDVRSGLIREVKSSNGMVTRYAVRFYDAWGRPFDVEVDHQIVRRDGKSLYMRSADTRTGAEEWAPTLVEKAYAKWRGSYETIGNGGWPGDVMQALTGSTASNRNISGMSDSAIIDGIHASVVAHKPVVAATFGKDSGVNYDGTGVYAWHAYVVLDAETRDGEKYVKLRNPWGVSEPAGNGPDDGIFEMKLADFRRLYQSLTFGGGLSADRTAPGAVSDLEVSETRPDAAVLTFTATGDDGTTGMATGYDVRVSTVPLTNSNFATATSVPVADPSLPGTEETVTLTNLSAGTYYVAVKVEDESGKVSSISNVVTVTVGDAPAESTVFDFTDGVQGWTSTGLFARVTEQNDPMFRMGDAGQNDYNVGSRPVGTLTSPAISLVNVTSPVVSWEQMVDLESGATYDRAWLEVSANGGAWTKVWEKNQPSQTFGVESVSLNAYAGQSVQLRFQFDAVDSEYNETRGWFIDDVMVAPE